MPVTGRGEHQSWGAKGVEGGIDRKGNFPLTLKGLGGSVCLKRGLKGWGSGRRMGEICFGREGTGRGDGTGRVGGAINFFDLS